MTEIRRVRRPEIRPGWGSAACLVLLLTSIVLTRADLLRGEWQSDTGGWMLISRLMNEGQTPYVDWWDNKLPPIYWLGQGLLLTGRPRAAMFAVDVGAGLLGALGIASILRQCKVAWPTALGCAGISACASVPFRFLHSNDVYAAAPFSIGIALFCWAIRRRSTLGVGLASWLAGTVVGVSAITTALLVPSGVVGTLIAWGAGRRSKRRVVAALGYALGGLSTVGALLFVADRGGYLRPMLDEAVFGAAKYASGGAGGAGAGSFPSLGKIVWKFRENVADGVLAWLPALLGTLGVVCGWSPTGRFRRVVCLFAVAWFATQVAMTFVSGAQYAHYHYLVAWASGLVAGSGLVALGWRRAWRPGLVAGALGVLVLLSFVLNGRIAASLMVLLRPAPRSQSARLGDMIRANVPPGDTLLLVDGYNVAMDAVVMLPNRPGSRHVLASMYEFVPIREAKNPFYGRLAQIMLDEFDRKPPDWLIRSVDHHDLFSPKVDRFYVEVCRNGEYVLYRKKGDAPG